jgi:hypothetical protein
LHGRRLLRMRTDAKYQIDHPDSNFVQHSEALG